VVMQNQCLVEVEGRAITASAGDLMIISQEVSHTLRDAADSRTVAIQSLLEPHHFERREPLAFGGGGPVTQLFCGCVLLEGLGRSPLRCALPTVIHVKGEQQRPLPYVNHIMSLLDLETNNRETCAHFITDRLMRILFLKAIQGYVSELPLGGASWLGALADPRIGEAIRLMHAELEAPWTLDSLARQVAMSRSMFSARFVELVGRPPMEYLTDWRMQKACCLLRTAKSELKEVAARAGYESAAAFSKAFARWAGMAPGAYRRSRAAAESAAVRRVPPI
jgi:AraC-like DNA-binding protein